MLPGNTVGIQRSDNEARKTKYDLISVYKKGSGWVNIDSQAPNKVVWEWLEKQEYDYVKPEYVWADQFKIEEVITNYISNAINHVESLGGEKAYIKIWLGKAGLNDKKVRIHVFNTGKHIPENDMDKIWDKFYKVDKARTREYGGSGVGLSIVKAIMNSHNQKCGADNVENGVDFWFELDCENA